jgi:HlyD family secretion protein
MDRQTAMQMQNPMLAGDGHFYTAKIELDMEEFNEIAKKHKLKLQPGMNADVLIITGERTLFRYLMDPITDHAFKAFIEK